MGLDPPESADLFIDFVLDAIENGDMILRIEEDAGWSLATTEKGKWTVARVNAEMN